MKSAIEAILDNDTLDSLANAAEYDTQEAALIRETYQALSDTLALTAGQLEAISRLHMIANQSGLTDWNGYGGMIRNNAFKAAHAIGIKLPSASF